MARRKNAKSLFEVITESPRPPAMPARPEGRPDTGEGGGVESPSRAPAATSEPAGRPAIALSQFNAVSIAAGVILLMLLAFLWGRAVGTRSARGAGGASPLGSEFIDAGSAGAGRAALPPMVRDDYKRKKGWRYWVIHENVASYKDGLAIKRLFHRNGVEVTVTRDPSLEGQYVIKDTQGFGGAPAAQMVAKARAREKLLGMLCELYTLQVRSGLISGRTYAFKKLRLETEE